MCRAVRDAVGNDFRLMLDSTWALFGTTLAVVLIQLPNLAWKQFGKLPWFKTFLNVDPEFQQDLSRRMDFHLYGRGMRLNQQYAWTQGNATSNGKTKRNKIRKEFIFEHERLHVIQSRIFGPLFQLIYAVWWLAGAIVGVLVAAGLRSATLQVIFGGLAFAIGLYMLFANPAWRLADEMPGAGLRWALSPLVGFLSVLMGIGGGSFGVPIMTR